MAGLRDIATTGDILTSVLRCFADRVAFRQDGKDWTYRQVEDVVARRAFPSPYPLLDPHPLGR